MIQVFLFGKLWELLVGVEMSVPISRGFGKGNREVEGLEGGLED